MSKGHKNTRVSVSQPGFEPGTRRSLQSQRIEDGSNIANTPRIERQLKCLCVKNIIFRFAKFLLCSNLMA